MQPRWVEQNTIYNMSRRASRRRECELNLGIIILDVPRPISYSDLHRRLVMADVLSHKRFHNEEEAYKWVEARLWPNGPVCPKCGGTHDRVTKLQGKSTRIGV